MSDRGRVCMHVPYLYPILSGGAIEFAGGLEVQQRLLARGLTRLGYDVSIVTCDYGQPARTKVEGLTLIKSFTPHGGLPVLRFLHPRLSRTVAALRSADADVYFMQGSGLLAGVTCDVAHARGRPFVFVAAHDWDVIRTLPFQTRARERWWYRRALRGADARITQTEFQRRALEEHFGLASTVIANPTELPDRRADPGGDGPVVWLATYKAAKRPEWFTELARHVPERRFVMCGVIPVPPLTREHWEAAQATARACPNLEVRGFLDHDRLAELFQGASLFVHTSPAEGFPNTLLEAWSYGVPSVTSVDPDGVITRGGMGEVATEFPRMLEAVRRMLADPELRRAAGARARAYVESHHGPERVYGQLAGVLDPLVAAGRARRSRG